VSYDLLNISWSIEAISSASSLRIMGEMLSQLCEDLDHLEVSLFLCDENIRCYGVLPIHVASFLKFCVAGVIFT